MFHLVTGMMLHGYKITVLYLKAVEKKLVYAVSMLDWFCLCSSYLRIENTCCSMAAGLLPNVVRFIALITK